MTSSNTSSDIVLVQLLSFDDDTLTPHFTTSHCHYPTTFFTTFTIKVVESKDNGRRFVRMHFVL